MHQKRSSTLVLKDLLAVTSLTLLAFFIFVPTITSANDDACAVGFASGASDPRRATLLEKLDKLDPTFAIAVRESHNSKSDQEILVLLKEQEFTFSDDYTMRWPIKKELSTQQISRLKAEFSNDFNLEKLSEPELRQFYANHLRQIYLWYGSVVAKKTTEEALLNSSLRLSDFDLMEQKILQAAIENLIGSHWLDRSTKPSQLAEMLQATPWIKVDFSLVAQYMKSRVYDSTVESKIAATAEQHVKSEQPMCCASKPGCRTCPINTGVRN